MFTGLSAFPLTPLANDRVDEESFVNLVHRAVEAGVDSITVLGSTGSYMYLRQEERARVVALAVEHAGDIPVIAGIGALRTSDVERFAADAQEAGASGVLLAPVSYQPLSEDDVFGLFADVTAGLSVPLAVYDNPGTTRFTFTDEMYVKLSELPNVASIKIPAVPQDQGEANSRVATLRALLPHSVTIGVSTDTVATQGLIAGCDAWYSVIAGTLPATARTITDPVARGDFGAAERASHALRPLWDLFDQHGSYRVIAVVAEHLGLTRGNPLPRPLNGLNPTDRKQVVDVVGQLDLRD